MRTLLASVALVIVACHPKAPPPKGESVDAASKRVLTTKDFPFCEKTDQAMPPWDRSWCDIADQATTCPQIKQMCDRKWEGRWLGDGDKSDTSDGKDPKTELGEGDWGGAFDKVHAPTMSGLSLLVWIAFGAVLAIVIAIITRAVIARREVEGATLDEDKEEIAAATLELADPGLGEVGLLLSKAQAEADRDVGKALALLYSAALRHLEDKGFIRWETSTTNRQYVREIRGRTPLDRPVADLVREVERTKFGHDRPQRRAFDALHGRIVSALTGVAALLVVMFMSGCAGDPSLEGHAAFNEILASQGIRPERLAVPIDKVTGTDPPIIVDSRDLPLDEAMLHAIERAVLAGSRILLLGDSRHRMTAWPSLSYQKSAAHDVEPTAEWAARRGLDPALKGVLPSSLSFELDPDEHDPPEVLLARDGAPFALRWTSDAGELLMVADRELFANASMAVPANAQLALALAKDVVGDRKELATAALGPMSGASSPEESLGQAGLLPLMIQALLALGVLFWARGAAFGTLRDRSVRARRTFAEHVSALGMQFNANKGSRFAASLYSAYALERMWDRAGREADRHDPASLATAVAARTNRPEGEVKELLVAAEDARRAPNGVPVLDHDMGLMRQLNELLTELHAE